MLRMIAMSVLCIVSVYAFGGSWQTMEQAAGASQSQPLSGTYVRQMGGNLQTFVIYRNQDRHRVLERRVAKDGVPREIIRSHRHLRFFAKDKAGIEQARMDGFKMFPIGLPPDAGMASDAYTLRDGGKDRVAGRPCQWFELKPKDKLRYTQKYCLDSLNRVPLKMQILAPNLKLIEQNNFTQIKFETPAQDMMRPDGALTVQEDSRLPPTFGIIGRGGKQGMGRWHRHQNKANAAYAPLNNLPQGFKVLAAREVRMPNHDKASTHYMIGDGLITVSLFIEPESSPQQKQVKVINGSLVMVKISKQGLSLTAVGDMPAAGLEQLLNNLRIG